MGYINREQVTVLGENTANLILTSLYNKEGSPDF